MTITVYFVWQQKAGLITRRSVYFMALVAHGIGGGSNMFSACPSVCVRRCVRIGLLTEIFFDRLVVEFSI